MGKGKDSGTQVPSATPGDANLNNHMEKMKAAMEHSGDVDVDDDDGEPDEGVSKRPAAKTTKKRPASNMSKSDVASMCMCHIFFEKHLYFIMYTRNLMMFWGMHTKH